MPTDYYIRSNQLHSSWVTQAVRKAAALVVFYCQNWSLVNRSCTLEASNNESTVVASFIGYHIFSLHGCSST